MAKKESGSQVNLRHVIIFEEIEPGLDHDSLIRIAGKILNGTNEIERDLGIMIYVEGKHFGIGPAYVDLDEGTKKYPAVQIREKEQSRILKLN